MKLLILLLNVAWIFCGTIDFTVKVIYLKPEKDVQLKISIFESALEKQLDSYNWKFPHDDFEKIETNISINIEKLASDKTFNGLITVSSGLASAKVSAVPLKKDIYFNEFDLTFSLDYDSEPQIEKMVPMSIETLVMFYTYLTLGENFDRLSYTDQKNFKMEGNYYFQQLYEFENILTNAEERISWNKRLEIIKTYRENKNGDLRKLNALIYNAVYFINSGKKDRAVYFIAPIQDTISMIFEFPENFFMNNFYALGEIFALSKDEKNLKFLIEKDPLHESYYSQKISIRPIREPVIEPVIEPIEKTLPESSSEPPQEPVPGVEKKNE